jgi:hypothetical protein
VHITSEAVDAGTGTLKVLNECAKRLRSIRGLKLVSKPFILTRIRSRQTGISGKRSRIVSIS